MKIAAINWKRAGAEFLVIVLGVLVALAVDQWRGEREDRRVEAEYVARLQKDLAADIENFRRLEEIFAIKKDVTGELRDHPESELLSYNSSEQARRLVLSGYVAFPDSASTTFDELVSTGRLALIQSIETRDALSQFYSGFEHISSIMFEPPGDYKKVLWESFPGELLVRGLEQAENLDESEVRDGVTALLADPRLKAAANSEMVYANTLIYYLSQKRTQAESLLELLEQTEANLQE